MNDFITKIEGEMGQSDSGVKRTIKTYTDRYDLVPIFMLKRWAELYGRGAVAHGDNNWMKASTQQDLDDFKRSFLHHTFQLLNGEKPEEDHAAAIMFNLAGIELVKMKLNHEIPL